MAGFYLDKHTLTVAGFVVALMRDFSSADDREAGGGQENGPFRGTACPTGQSSSDDRFDALQRII